MRRRASRCCRWSSFGSASASCRRWESSFWAPWCRSSSCGATEWMVFKSVVMPATLPFILSGLRIALGRALVGVMVGELYAATAGIGFMITVADPAFQTDKVFVGVIIFAISGMLGMELLSRIEKHFDKWRPRVGAQA